MNEWMNENTSFSPFPFYYYHILAKASILTTVAAATKTKIKGIWLNTWKPLTIIDDRIIHSMQYELNMNVN